jgi:hypothetical protein
MSVQTCLLVEELPRPSHPLQRHPAVDERPHDAERYEVAERVQTRHAWATAGSLDGRFHQSDLVPIAELA